MEWRNEGLVDIDPQWMNYEDPQFLQSVLSSPEEEGLSSEGSPQYLQPHSPSSSRLILLHKPRGSKGVWQEVEEGMKLRVSKPNGKKLKLQLLPEFEYDKNSPRLELLESQDETNTFVVSNARFEVELVKTLDRSVDIEVKLFQPSKRLMFRLTVQNLGGSQTSVAKSVEFSTQSSGGHLRDSSASVDSFVEMTTPNNKRVRAEELEISSDKTTVVPGSLQVTGIVRAKAFMQFSDMRLKTGIEDIVDALQIITHLEGKSYQWKGDVQENGGRRVLGLIAQEVQRVLPEVVTQDPKTGMLSISYTEILPVLIEAFKEFVNNYNDNQRDIHKELDQFKRQLEFFSRQLTKARATEKEKINMIANLARTSQLLFKPSNHPYSAPPFAQNPVKDFNVNRHQQPNHWSQPQLYNGKAMAPHHPRPPPPQNRPPPPHPFNEIPLQKWQQQHDPAKQPSSRVYDMSNHQVHLPHPLAYPPSPAYPPSHTYPPSPAYPLSQPLSQPTQSVQQPYVPKKVGVDFGNSQRLWTGGRIRAYMQAALFLVFLGSLVCFSVGIYFLVDDGNVTTPQSVTTTPPNTSGLLEDDNIESTKTNLTYATNGTQNTQTATISMRGICLTVAGVAGMIASCVGFICIIFHRKSSSGKQQK